MSVRLLITTVNEDGIVVYKDLDNKFEEDLLNLIREKSYRDDMLPTFLSWKGFKIYSKPYKKTNEGKRDDVFGIHIISKLEISDADGLLERLASAFEKEQLHELPTAELKKIEFAILNRLNNITVSKDGNGNRVELDIFP